MATIKIGDTVTYRGCFGMDAPTQVKVTGLSLTEYPREKYGDDVDEVDTQLVQSNRVLFSFDDGHWAYSDQVVL